MSMFEEYGASNQLEHTGKFRRFHTFGRLCTIFDKETIFGLPAHQAPSEKGSTIKEKNLWEQILSFKSSSLFRRGLS